jgi:hypothetical protein
MFTEYPFLPAANAIALGILSKLRGIPVLMAINGSASSEWEKKTIF